MANFRGAFRPMRAKNIFFLITKTTLIFEKHMIIDGYRTLKRSNADLEKEEGVYLTANSNALAPILKEATSAEIPQTSSER